METKAVVARWLFEAAALFGIVMGLRKLFGID